ncbi:MAG: 4Fe-4S dicluster domain-containing protein [Acidobacteriota bacterium]
MSVKTNKKKLLRIISQILFLVVFFYLLIRTGAAATESFVYSDYFFYFDPLLLIINFLATHTLAAIFLLSLIPVFLTLIFGRFFCGWICPMGTINHFFSWIFRRKKTSGVEVVEKKLLKLKYIILLFVIVMTIFGTNIGGWFDPFSLLTRSTTLVVNPSVNYLTETTLKAGAKDTGILAKGLKPVYNFAKEKVLPNKKRGYLQSVLIGIIFFLIIISNYYKRRFYCNYICPLGALYGLISKFSLLNLRVDTKSCKECNICSSGCTYNGSPFKDYLKSECMVCYNCEDDCTPDSITTEFRFKGVERNKIDLGRRRMSGSIVSGIFLSSLPRISGVSISKTHPFERPPGSVTEDEFLDKCIRCGECMQACPTNFIQPAFFETGIDGIWTPILEALTGYCEYECNRCTQVCPTNAIEKLTLEQKKEFKIGTAVIDKDRCYTYADGYNCAVCEEHCPVPEKAIRFREVDTWNFEGKLVKVKQIYVIPDLCIGCGICENVCPRSDAPGIINTSEEEQREFEY